tara:strand:- start:82 stop:678 length:597 start_codon:yes stop_codon:yes gene_type:complete
MEFAGEFFKPPNEKYPTTIKDYIYDDTHDPSIINLDYVGFVWHLILESDLDKNKIDKFIVLERRNKLEQLVSLIIAGKTGIFSNAKTTERIEVNPDHIAFFINKNKDLYLDFRNSIQDYKNVYYEDLCGNFKETIKDINNYLGVGQSQYFHKHWGENWFRTNNGEIMDYKGLYLKQETRPMKEVIINYEDVKEYDRLW